MARSKSVRGAASSDKKSTAPKRGYMKQSDVPIAALEDALRIPRAIFEHYAGKPTTPLQVAKALNVDPLGSQIRVLSGASIAFGLIEGGAQAASISLTPLATKIVRPKTEDEDAHARREAVLRPRIFREFLERYSGHAFPRPDIAVNVLEEMGVPRGKATEVLERLEASAKAVGFLHPIKDKLYVDLSGTEIPSGNAEQDEEDDPASAIDANAKAPFEGAAPKPTPLSAPAAAIAAQSTTLSAAVADDARRRRVFITHGKDRALVDPIKKLLEYGELEPVVSVERQSVSKPVPEKFMGEMRTAGAAIIHVDAERTLKDEEGNEHVMLNPNVLIEIGAAMAFYGRRFILLVRDGVKLPSNLQGLYEVRYKGDTLDADATIRLLEAMKDIKNQPLPSSLAVGD
jgi:predicted nucleotide-binding protein